MTYSHGHRLDFVVTIDVTPGYPDWLVYSFQVRDASDRCLFRYDNAPHHPDLPTFPHHKHVGPSEVPRAHHLPSLHDLVDEIVQATSAPRADAPG
jgi:hypothetical protein